MREECTLGACATKIPPAVVFKMEASESTPAAAKHLLIVFEPKLPLATAFSSAVTLSATDVLHLTVVVTPLPSARTLLTICPHF